MIELDDTRWWPRVTHEGLTWAVAPRYIHGAAIGDELARQNGCELPTPGLVDAIWRAADVRCDPNRLVRRHDGTHATMSSESVLADQAERVAREIERASVGLLRVGGHEPLVACTHKDIVRLPSGQVGIYGWHRLDGSRIQPASGVHARGYVDYSQGLRLCKRVAIAPSAALCSSTNAAKPWPASPNT